ncbi:tRNA methyltransferase complex GCD14 subunit-domain-containing protein [Diplogelasinospora grovesii]|uniref:tRNA (adenine(58)-N(1))-methyltransferase catalytic subunit TRM61 n=1 Tax=Diplogelasinospora grovesii TaxID=303347 RepID=A0AAN6S993_9PEZI|nr:tRNA methyltransferase complex GCD14 subunit-domain-containing protein [Diplogelasinospora grovesii]
MNMPTMVPVLRHNISPFLDPGSRTKANSLAIVQLSRDNLVPVYLQRPTGEHDGYKEGAVVNTKYGSYPHSTMLDVPWGSQIRASKVDTGSRGRKRKRPDGEDAGRPATDNNNNNNNNNTEEKTVETPKEESEPTNGAAAVAKPAVDDNSGFIHILPPTPEIWTMSLPHRTQVVYTPDYSYILHRIRARPGSVLIEAGAGSGSFSHASARAVFNGYPTPEYTKRKGKVYSFEYHEQRYHKMKSELEEHGLEGIVQLTHRDVYKDGFNIDGVSPQADAVFLDLPAPWEALQHLVRRRSTPGNDGWVSPLNPSKSVYICTFSPCIEQVTKTVSAMRRLGWVDIEMVEIAHRKLHTVRDRIGLNLPVDRGVNNSPKDVEEALARLTEIENRAREHARDSQLGGDDADATPMDVDTTTTKQNGNDGRQWSSKPWLDGRLVTRGEPEVKTHTSYLVFAILPREWTEEQEAAALARWPCGGEPKQVIGSLDKASRKKERREMLEKAGKSGDRNSRRKERIEQIGSPPPAPAQ